MIELKFIKDHSSRRFKKGDVVEMPDENVKAWIDAGYCKLQSDVGDTAGNVETSTEVGGGIKESSANGGNLQKKLSKKNKKKNRKN